MNGRVRTLTPNEIESFQLRVPPPSLFLLLLPRSYQCPRSKGRNVFSHAEIPPSIAFVGIASSRTPTTSVWRAGIINVHFEATSDVVLGTLVFWNKCPLRASTYRYIGAIDRKRRRWISVTDDNIDENGIGEETELFVGSSIWIMKTSVSRGIWLKSIF